MGELLLHGLLDRLGALLHHLGNHLHRHGSWVLVQFHLLFGERNRCKVRLEMIQRLGKDVSASVGGAPPVLLL